MSVASLWVTGAFAALLLILAGCVSQQDVEPMLVVENTDAAYIDSAIPTPTSDTSNDQSVSVQSTAIPEPTATAQPTTIPTPTSIPVVKFFVPDQWLKEAAIATSSIESNAEWELAENPAVAQIVMYEGTGDVGAGTRPIALVVPFTDPLLELTLEEARHVIEAGSEDILAVDWWEVPRGYRAVPVDSLLPNQENYLPVRQWSLDYSAGYEQYARELGLALAQQLGTESLVHLAAVGDIMLDRTLGNYIANGELDFPFAQVGGVLTGADITVGNLETALGDSGEPVRKSYNFLSPPSAAQSLARAGFDLVSLANNHAMDFGPEKLLQGIELLTEQGVMTVGAGANSEQAREAVIIERNGLTVAFLSYVDVPVEVTGFDTRLWEAGAASPGLAWADPGLIASDAASAAAQADVVVVLLHSGYEFIEAPGPQQIAAAEAAIDGGADLVLSHHSHLLQGIDFYKDGVILYGLGNFAFNMDGSSDSAIFNIWLDETGVRNIDLTPVTIGLGGQPALASPADAWRIRQDVAWLTDTLNRP